MKLGAQGKMFLRIAIAVDTILTLLPYAIGGFFLLFTVVAIIAFRMAKKRREAFRAVAESLNMSFSKKDPGLLKELGHFQLFSKGHGRKISNVMQGRTRSANVAIFDYDYRLGGNRSGGGSYSSSNVESKTVIAFQSPTLNLPAFSIRPENLLDKWHNLSGYQDINFDSHPGFSDEYMLMGKDERTIRRLFTRDVLDYFQEHDGSYVEAGAGRLIFYRWPGTVKPDNIRAFMKDGFTVLNFFKRKG